MDLKKFTTNDLKLFDKYNLDNEDQLIIAIKVRDQAIANGINPDFVLPMVRAESNFNQNAISDRGAIGVMQLMPPTATSLKVDPKDIDQNISGGMSLLKELISNPKIGNDPYKVIVGYNTDTATRNKFYASDGDLSVLPKATLIHINNIEDYYGGALPNVSITKNEETPPDNAKEVVTDSPYSGESLSNYEDQKQNRESDRAFAGAALGAAGAGFGAVKVPVFNLARKTMSAINSMVTGNKLTPSEITNLIETTNKGTGVPIGPKDAGYMARGQTGAQIYNYAKSLGLSDIDALKVTNATKEEGGAHYILNEKIAKELKLKKMFPSDSFSENPAFGGLYTEDKTHGVNPRATTTNPNRGTFVNRSPVVENGKVVQQGGLEQLPPKKSSNTAQNITTSPQSRSGSNFLSSVAGSSPLMGGLAGYGIGYNAQDAYDKYLQGDVAGTAQSGLGAIASGAALIPRAAPFAGAVSGAIDANRRLQEKDYLGSIASMIGAAAPYAAPFMFGPQVGIPVGVATALGMPIAQEAGSYLKKYMTQ